MAIHRKIDKAERLVYTRCSGPITLKDIELYIHNTWGDRSYYGFYELFDITQGDWENFEFSYLFTIAKRVAALDTIDPNSKLALVVLKGKQMELMAFYKNAKAMLPVKSREIEAFYSMDKAMEWLYN